MLGKPRKPPPGHLSNPTLIFTLAFSGKSSYRPHMFRIWLSLPGFVFVMLALALGHPFNLTVLAVILAIIVGTKDKVGAVQS